MHDDHSLLFAGERTRHPTGRFFQWLAVASMCGCEKTSGVNSAKTLGRLHRARRACRYVYAATIVFSR
eukprot:COSAG02_NODE_39402_length_417_cov_1.248428_1_plen_67_part_01